MKKSNHPMHLAKNPFLVFVSLFSFAGFAETTKQQSLPQLPEVIEAISRHLPHISQEEMDRAALQGILTEFQSQVELIPSTKETSIETATALNRFYESSIGYLAVPLLKKSASASFKNALIQLEGEHLLRGMILDLRHVSGTHYESIVEIVGFFTSRVMPLIDWGEGMKSIQPQSILLKTPLIALIDETTMGAGEALAAAIRSAQLGLLVGRPTAGDAHRFEEVALKSGQILRLASGAIEMANGELLGTKGVHPDIVVSPMRVSPSLQNSHNSQNSQNRIIKEDEPSLENAPLPVPADDPILQTAWQMLKAIGIVEKRNRPE